MVHYRLKAATFSNLEQNCQYIFTCVTRVKQDHLHSVIQSLIHQTEKNQVILLYELPSTQEQISARSCKILHVSVIYIQCNTKQFGNLINLLFHRHWPGQGDLCKEEAVKFRKPLLTSMSLPVWLLIDNQHWFEIHLWKFFPVQASSHHDSYWWLFLSPKRAFEISDKEA